MSTVSPWWLELCESGSHHGWDILKANGQFSLSRGFLCGEFDEDFKVAGKRLH